MSSMRLTVDQYNELLYIGFNQDYGCVACGTDSGFRIFNVEPFRETYRKVFSSGGIGIVEMLFRCNLVALVGGGRNPRYPPHKVMIWDDYQNRCIGELSFRSEVKAVKLRRDRIVVALSQKVYVYRFSDLKLLDQIQTVKNDSGLLALSVDASNAVVVCPGVSRGHIRIEQYDVQKSTLIPAHDSALAQIVLNRDSTCVATASDKGTLIRIFDVASGTLLHELRRGMDRADITSIAFNATSTFIACCSDRGTAHVFSLTAEGDNAQERKRSTNLSGERRGGRNGYKPDASDVATSSETQQRNQRSGLSFLSGIMPSAPRYFTSEWSFAQLRGLEGHSLCAFGIDPHTLIIISADGSFMTAKFNEPGEMERIGYAKFIRESGEAGPETRITVPLGGGTSAASGTPTTISRVPIEESADEDKNKFQADVTPP